MNPSSWDKSAFEDGIEDANGEPDTRDTLSRATNKRESQSQEVEMIDTSNKLNDAKAKHNSAAGTKNVDLEDGGLLVGQLEAFMKSQVTARRFSLLILAIGWYETVAK
jgi:hypothetical protein